MPPMRDRDSHRAWAHLTRALGINSAHAFDLILRSRRRIWRAVR